MECITNETMETIPVNKQEVVVHMKNKIRWFNNEDVFGYVEHKRNGDIIVCCSKKDFPEEYVRLNLVKKGDLFELKKED